MGREERRNAEDRNTPRLLIVEWKDGTKTEIECQQSGILNTGWIGYRDLEDIDWQINPNDIRRFGTKVEKSPMIQVVSPMPKFVQ
jgi:hypothetical protein